VHGVSSETMRLFQEYHDATMSEVERRLGKFRARRVQLANHSIFPNGILGHTPCLFGGEKGIPCLFNLLDHGCADPIADPDGQLLVH
jgi:hypothetical protein